MYINFSLCLYLSVSVSLCLSLSPYFLSLIYLSITSCLLLFFFLLRYGLPLGTFTQYHSQTVFCFLSVHCFIPSLIFINTTPLHPQLRLKDPKILLLLDHCLLWHFFFFFFCHRLSYFRMHTETDAIPRLFSFHFS